MSSSPRRKIGVLLVAAVLLAPVAAVAEPSARADQHGPWASLDLLSRLWSAVAALWAGCSVDPFGECGATSVAPEATQSGCSVDPYGICGSGNAIPEPTENLNNGCGMDPYGICGSGG